MKTFTLKCVICEKEAEYIMTGYSQCDSCLRNDHDESCYDLSSFPVRLICQIEKHKA